MTITISIPMALNFYYILAAIWACVSVWVSICIIDDIRSAIYTGRIMFMDAVFSVALPTILWGTVYALYIAGVTK